MEGQPSWCQPHILLDCRVNGGTAVLVPATLQDQWRDSRPVASHTYSWTAGPMEGQPSWCKPHILLTGSMEGQPSWGQPHILLDCRANGGTAVLVQAIHTPDRVNGGTAVLVPAAHTPGQGQWRDSCPGASHTYSWTAGSMEGQPSWCQPHILLDYKVNGGTAILVPATHNPRLQGQWRDSGPGATHTYSWTAGSMEGPPSWCQAHILLYCRVNGGTAVLVPATHTPGLQGQWRDSHPGASHTYSWTAGSMEGQPTWCQPHILLDCRVNGETAVLVPATHTPGLEDQFRDSRHGASHTYSWTAGSMEGQWSRCHPHILLDCRVNGGTADLVPATHTPGLQDQWRDSRPGASHTYSWTAGSMEGQPSWCQPLILLDCRINGGTAVLVPATHTPGLQGQWRDSCPGASHTYSWTGSMEGQLSWCQPHILLDCRVNGGTAVLVPPTYIPGLQGQCRDRCPGASHTYSWTAGSMKGQLSWCQPHILLHRVNGGTAVLVPATRTPGLQDQWRVICPGASHTYSWTAGSMEGQPSWCQPHILLDCRVNGGTAVLVPATHTPGLQDQWRVSCPGASHTYSWTAGSMEGQPSWCQPHILLDCRVNGGTAVLVSATHNPGLQGQWRDSRPGASHTYSWTARSLMDSCPGASHTYPWTAGSMEGQPSWCQPHIILDCRVNGGTAVLVPATHTPGLHGH
ncbi:hypothetical protein NDU88_007821 [Pleurodeles waltl]|uniref:Uncharacterized protein n=1 Tax=Pleurodeles waltl TaxID=8319 RepID=A0AAV7LUY4_PLEWA|nr:hypothetical protein NDU88_007821 [Pleurodeles waltl]